MFTGMAKLKCDMFPYKSSFLLTWNSDDIGWSIEIKWI